MDEDRIKLLNEIGFNDLEALIYITLLKKPNVTGYKIAKQIGKPVSNTYKALESLRTKGAVIVDNSAKSQLYMAIPIAEYMDQLERGFEARRKKLEEALENVGELHGQEGIYRLDNIEQLYERGINMLKSAKDVVLVDSKDEGLLKIKPTLEKIAKRGVKVLIQGPDIGIEGCENITISEKVYENPYGWFNMVVDGEQYLSALVKENEEGIYEAVWSRNLYLSILTHYSYINEFIVTKIMGMLKAKTTTKKISDEIKRIFLEYYLKVPVLDKVKSIVKLG
ncbi:hypothetical protein JXI42_10390 [bacterium]|nr:hypothetical protein [bacterium]